MTEILVRIGAICWDGWESKSTGRGTGKGHGGVKQWIYKKVVLPPESTSQQSSSNKANPSNPSNENVQQCQTQTQSQSQILSPQQKRSLFQKLKWVLLAPFIIIGLIGVGVYYVLYFTLYYTIKILCKLIGKSPQKHFEEEKVKSRYSMGSFIGSYPGNRSSNYSQKDRYSSIFKSKTIKKSSEKYHTLYSFIRTCFIIYILYHLKNTFWGQNQFKLFQQRSEQNIKLLSDLFKIIGWKYEKIILQNLNLLVKVTFVTLIFNIMSRNHLFKIISIISLSLLLILNQNLVIRQGNNFRVIPPENIETFTYLQSHYTVCPLSISLSTFCTSFLLNTFQNANNMFSYLVSQVGLYIGYGQLNIDYMDFLWYLLSLFCFIVTFRKSVRQTQTGELKFNFKSLIISIFQIKVIFYLFFKSLSVLLSSETTNLFRQKIVSNLKHHMDFKDYVLNLSQYGFEQIRLSSHEALYWICTYLVLGILLLSFLILITKSRFKKIIVLIAFYTHYKITQSIIQKNELQQQQNASEIDQSVFNSYYMIFTGLMISIIWKAENKNVRQY